MFKWIKILWLWIVSWFKKPKVELEEVVPEIVVEAKPDIVPPPAVKPITRAITRECNRSIIR